MRCYFLLQGIFLTQRSNLGLLQCRQTLYRLGRRGSQWVSAVVMPILRMRRLRHKGVRELGQGLMCSSQVAEARAKVKQMGPRVLTTWPSPSAEANVKCLAQRGTHNR